MTKRPALRTGLVGVSATVLAFAVIAAWLGVASHRLHELQALATAVAAGTVVADGLGDEGDILVRWRDAAGREHQQRFGIYDTDRYQRGTTFDVRYDPADPDARAYPADPEETSAVDDLEVPIMIAGVIALLVLAGWGWRGLRFRRRSQRRPSSAFGQALSGEILDSAPIQFGSTCWVALRDSREGAVRAWQRVMWHPALALAHEVAPVQVHGDIGGRRGVVITLPAGTGLVPIGRLRHKEPSRFILEPRAETTLDDDSLFIIPRGTVLPPPHPWWHQPAKFTGVGALVGVVMALLFGGGSVAVVPFAAGAAALLLNVWAFTGSEA